MEDEIVACGSFLFKSALSTSRTAATLSSIDAHARSILLFASLIFRCFDRLCVFIGETASSSRLVFIKSLASSLAISLSISDISQSVSLSVCDSSFCSSIVAFLKQFLQSCQPGIALNPFCLSFFARSRVILWPPFTLPLWILNILQHLLNLRSNTPLNILLWCMQIVMLVLSCCKVIPALIRNISCISAQ